MTDQPDDLTGARTTPDNPATSSDAADNPLREQIAAALLASWDTGVNMHRDEAIRRDTDAVMVVRDREMEQLRAKVAEIDHIINWHTTCASCARILDSSYAETMRAERAEAALARVKAACDQMHRASVLADGEPHTDHERGILQAVRRVLAALDPPTERAADTGPTVAEAAKDDRRWPLQKAGE